jgi:hypothetical protein
MKNRLNVASAATLTLLTMGVFGPARGQEAFQPFAQRNGFVFCAAGPGACQRFQGYIYVGRAAGAQAEPKGFAAPPADSPTLGEERLYIHLGGEDR